VYRAIAGVDVSATAVLVAVGVSPIRNLQAGAISKPTKSSEIALREFFIGVYLDHQDAAAAANAPELYSRITLKGMANLSVIPICRRSSFSILIVYTVLFKKFFPHILLESNRKKVLYTFISRLIPPDHECSRAYTILTASFLMKKAKIHRLSISFQLGFTGQ
jgi:hypothetical protein